MCFKNQYRLNADTHFNVTHVHFQISWRPLYISHNVGPQNTASAPAPASVLDPTDAHQWNSLAKLSSTDTLLWANNDRGAFSQRCWTSAAWCFRPLQQSHRSRWLCQVKSLSRCGFSEGHFDRSWTKNCLPELLLTPTAWGFPEKKSCLHVSLRKHIIPG